MLSSQWPFNDTNSYGDGIDSSYPYDCLHLMTDREAKEAQEKAQLEEKLALDTARRDEIKKTLHELSIGVSH